MVFLVSSVIVLNLTDLLTTTIALGKGLEEGNVMLLSLTSFLRLRFIDVIALTKIGFIMGALVLCYVGFSSSALKIRKMMLRAMAAFTLVLLVVSLNNFILIYF